MAQFYLFDWVSPPSEKPDQHGNHWYTVVIGDDKVAILAKNAPEAGRSYYGYIEDVTSKAGKQYRRFRRQQVPEDVEIPRDKPQGPKQQSMGLEFQQLVEVVKDLEERVKRLEDGEGALTEREVEDIPF